LVLRILGFSDEIDISIETGQVVCYLFATTRARPQLEDACLIPKNTTTAMVIEVTGHLNFL